MGVTSSNGITTLKPTAWKWYAGGAVMFSLVPGFGMLIGLAFILMGAGVLQNVTLTKDGVKVRNWFSIKSYAWQEIDDFRVYKVRSGLITAASMVSFTHVDKQGSVMGKAAKFLVGGTHSIPAVGMPAKKLAQLMQAYKLGFVPKDSAAPEIAPSAPVPGIPSTAKRKPVVQSRAKTKPDTESMAARTSKKRPTKPSNRPAAASLRRRWFRKVAAGSVGVHRILGSVRDSSWLSLPRDSAKGPHG